MHIVAIVCTAILGLLLFALGLAVSILRGKYKTLIGQPNDPTHLLQKIVRAHGNTAEYAPFLAVLFLYLGSRGPSLWVLWAIGITTAARVAIVVGLLTCNTLSRPHPVRFLGALGTYLGGIALCVAMVTGA